MDSNERQIWALFHGLWGNYVENKPYSSEIKNKFGKLLFLIQDTLRERVDVGVIKQLSLEEARKAKIREVTEKLDKQSDNEDMFAHLGEQLESAAKETDNLFCYGCAHSAASEPFPGAPSGERPCHFCIRNKDRERWQKDFSDRYGVELKAWYDNSPIAFYPIDAYQTLDMIEQYARWERKAKGDPDWNKPSTGIRFG